MLLPASDTDVLVESGESGIGVSGAVEQVVVEDEGMEDIDESGSGVIVGGGCGGVTEVCVRSDGNASGLCRNLEDCEGSCMVTGFGEIGGEGGGVVVEMAF